MGASRPDGAARLLPNGMGLEDLPGPFPLSVARLIVLAAASVSRPSGHQWLLLSVRHGYEPAYPRLEEFPTSQNGISF